MANPLVTFNLIRDGSHENGLIYNYTYIATQTTTLIKTGQGLLHSITFNKPVATGTVELDNAITQTNPFGIITTPANPQLVTLVYDVIFGTGLSITTAVASQDITVAWL